MNCPGNILVFKASQHSYRELPIKAIEEINYEYYKLSQRFKSFKIISNADFEISIP